MASGDYQQAADAIRQYRIENRGWPWQRELFRPGLLFDWGSLPWVALLVLFFWLDAQIDLRARGLMDPTALGHGQWWRLFSGIWLHADISHLAANATIGFVAVTFALVLGRHLNKVALHLPEPRRSLLYSIYYAIPHLELFRIATKLVTTTKVLLSIGPCSKKFAVWQKPHNRLAVKLSLERTRSCSAPRARRPFSPKSDPRREQHRARRA